MHARWDDDVTSRLPFDDDNSVWGLRQRPAQSCSRAAVDIGPVHDTLLKNGMASTSLSRQILKPKQLSRGFLIWSSMHGISTSGETSKRRCETWMPQRIHGPRLRAVALHYRWYHNWRMHLFLHSPCAAAFMMSRLAWVNSRWFPTTRSGPRVSSTPLASGSVGDPEVRRLAEAFVLGCCSSLLREVSSVRSSVLLLHTGCHPGTDL